MADLIHSRPLKKGDVVNDTYEIQFFIGQGAFGEVYRVRHKHLGVQVMKVFKDEYVRNTDLNVVTKEARILAKLTHPNIVRVFETNSFKGGTGERFFITLGFVSGETLADLLKRKGQLPIKEACSLQNDLLTGLRFVQEQKPPIVHRDVNTDNILLSYESDKAVALLSDFGLAQSLDQFSQIPGAAGRYPYFAPECFFGTYLPTSDVFSTGIVLYQMIVGNFPWKYDFSETGDDSEKIATMVMAARKQPIAKPSELVNDCDHYLDRVILKALSKNIEDRYKTAEEFLAELTDARANAGKVQFAGAGVATAQDGKKFSVRVPGKGFDEIAGMDELKETLYYDVILPLKEKHLYEEYQISVPNGMMLYGPPGCGKTFIARKFADEIKYNYIEIKPSDIASIYVHGTQEKIGELFRKARENAPTILFIDEVDAILPNREGDLQQSYASEVNEFLAQMTDAGKQGIFVIAATNRPEKIDPAILRTGRMDKVVYLAPPDALARIALFKLYLGTRPVEEGLDFERLAELTHNYVASDIVFLINEAARGAMRKRTKIGQSDLEEAIKTHPPSISNKQIKKYEEFKDKRSFS